MNPDKTLPGSGLPAVGERGTNAELATMTVPFESEGLLEAAVPGLPVQTIAVAGGKGGTGKSTVAVNLSVAMALAGHDVILLDADFGLSNVECLLDLQSRFNLSHVMKGECELRDTLLAGPGGIRVVPGANGALEMVRMSQIQHAGLIAMFSEVAGGADTLIIDIASGLSDSVLSYSRAAREVIVVICDDPTSIHDAFGLIRVLSESCQIDRFRILVNQTVSTHQGLDLYGALVRIVDRHLDVLLDYCGSIPFDPQLKKSISRQRPVVEAYPRSPSALAFGRLASRVKRWPQPRHPGGHVEFFVERLVHAASGSR